MAAIGGAVAGDRSYMNLYTLSIKPGNIRECSLIYCTSIPGPAIPCPNPEVKYTDNRCTFVFTRESRYTTTA